MKANKLIIAGVNRKGGSGKTTLIYNLAGILAQRGHPVTILDSDPQRSLHSTWERRREDIPIEVIPVSEEFELDHEVFKRPGYIFIDTPPVMAAPIRRALAVANIALVPIRPSPLDLAASLPIRDLGSKAREVNPRLKLHWVINQIKKGTVIADIIREASANREKLPMVKTTIPDTVALMETMAYGIPLCYYQNNHPAVWAFKRLLKGVLHGKKE